LSRKPTSPHWSGDSGGEHYDFGDIVVYEGDEADSFYILTSGRVRVVKKTGPGEELALQTLRRETSLASRPC
jgi:CRP-like cAMP-binding protein